MSFIIWELAVQRKYNCIWHTMLLPLFYLPMKTRSQILDENLLAQRGEETIRWPSFWPETQQESVSLAVPNQNDYETLSSSLLLPMRFSILLPGLSIFSTASSCQLGAGSVSRSTADFINTALSFRVRSNILQQASFPSSASTFSIFLFNTHHLYSLQHNLINKINTDTCLL